MKNLLLASSLILLFQATTLGQGTFIKTIDTANSGKNVRVFQTNDQGLAVFSLDSLKLYKFNSCGNPEWAKHYSIPIGFYPGDIIKTRNGGFVLLNRIPNGNVHYSVITLLNASGDVIWSKSLEDPDYIQYPYTISEDINGNFIVLGNVSHINSQPYYNSITKLDANGNLLWTRFYSFGPIWGGAIVTSDNGILARIGNTLIKTDNSGNVQWASAAIATTHHLAPIETSDGYIFSGYIPGSNKITFHKLDRQGNLLWGGRKVLDYTGIPPLLHQKSNGNFVGVFNRTISGKNHISIIEFDKDLAVVRQNTIKYYQNGTALHGWNIGFSDENTTVLAGTALTTSGPSLFFTKTNNLLQTGCDTTLATTIVTEPVTHTFGSSNVIPHTFSVVNKNFSILAIPSFTTTLCSSNTIPQLKILSDSILCEGTSLILKNQSGIAFNTYLWSTGETTETIAVTKPGKYWLRATYNCGANTVSDTVTVTEFIFPPHALTADSAICGAKPVMINAEIPSATYRWQDGTTNPVYYATKPGKYEVDITYSNCTKRFSVRIGDYEKLVMPNIFTPNGDGLNEYFAPTKMCGIASGTLKIYNRWGQLLFTTPDIGKGWNGMVSGTKKADGVYFYLVEYSDFRNQRKTKKGWLELLGN